MLFWTNVLIDVNNLNFEKNKWANSKINFYFENYENKLSNSQLNKMIFELIENIKVTDKK